MTDEQPRKQEIDVNVRFPKPPPRPAKVHRVRDVMWIFLACSIIGTVFRSPAVVVIAFAICLTLYLVGGPVVKRQP